MRFFHQSSFSWFTFMTMRGKGRANRVGSRTQLTILNSLGCNYFLTTEGHATICVLMKDFNFTGRLTHGIYLIDTETYLLGFQANSPFLKPHGSEVGFFGFRCRAMVVVEH